MLEPPATTATTMRLFFAVVGEASVGFVDIDGGEPIHAVRIAIKEMLPHDCLPIDLTLFTTKRSGSNDSPWLIADSNDAEALQQTPVSDELKQRYLAREYKLNPATRVRKHLANVSDEDEVIHVLVVLPEHLSELQSRKRSPESLDALTPPSTRPRPSPLTSPLTQEYMQQLQADVLRSLSLMAFVVHWVPAANEYPELPLPDAGCFLTIPLRYFAHSGVRTPVSDQDAMLYIRKAVAQEWHAIQEWTIDLPSRLWIVGAPGAGKSCAAFAFACSIARAKWNVLWMRYEPRQNKVSCVKFVGNEKATFEFHGIDAARAINGLIAPWLPVPSTPLIVFFDGYNKTVSCQIIEQVLLAWQTDDPRNRRLVCVASMASRGKENNPSATPVVEADDGTKVKVEKQFTLASWTLEEYEQAVQHEPFFASVSAKLEPESSQSTDALSATEPTLGAQVTPLGVIEAESHDSHVTAAPALDVKGLVNAKFYIAGGSARAMFEDTTSEAVDNIRVAIRAVKDFHGLATGNIGGASPDVVNRLVAVYGAGEELDFTIVSLLAVRMLTVKLDPEKILSITRAICANPAMDGFAFEAFVLASIAAADVPYELSSDANSLSRKWKKTNVTFFDPAVKFDKLELRNNWNVPKKWNQSGYDAVVKEEVDGSAYVTFLQMTRSKQHSFKTKAFYELLQKLYLSRPLKQVVRVDLHFVVPSDVVKDFKAPVSHADFWREVVEVADPIRAKGITCTIEVVGVRYPNFNDVSYLWNASD